MSSTRHRRAVLAAIACSTIALAATLADALPPQQGAPPQLEADPPIACESCDRWNAQQAPFRVFGNTYYVGPAGVAAVLVTSPEGHVLLDGGLPQSAARIDESIRALGFRTADVRLILNSHAHYDHAGGIAALRRASGATAAASADGARALERGGPFPDDPQFAFGQGVMGFPPVARVRVVQDGETLTVGPLAVTAHLTSGHTPGSTSWTWRSCDGDRCLDVVYADSLNPVSAPGFRFSAQEGAVERFRRSIAAVAALPCDILLSVHPEVSDMPGRLERRSAGASPDPFIDRDACRAYAANAARALEGRLAEENAVR